MYVILISTNSFPNYLYTTLVSFCRFLCLYYICSRNGVSTAVPLIAETVPAVLAAGPAPAVAAAAAAALAANGHIIDPLCNNDNRNNSNTCSSSSSSASSGYDSGVLPVYVAANFAGFQRNSASHIASANGSASAGTAVVAGDAPVARFYPQHPIHVYNKCNNAPLTALERHFTAQRLNTNSSKSASAQSAAQNGVQSGMNVLLLGDSLGDATIEGSLPGASTVLKVGFLNLRPGVTAAMATDGDVRARTPHTCAKHAHANSAHANADTQSQSENKTGAKSTSAGASAPDGCHVPTGSDSAAEFNKASSANGGSAPASTATAATAVNSAAATTNSATAKKAAAPLTGAELASGAAHGDCWGCVAQVAAARLRKHCEAFDLVVIEDGSLDVARDLLRDVIAHSSSSSSSSSIGSAAAKL